MLSRDCQLFLHHEINPFFTVFLIKDAINHFYSEKNKIYTTKNYQYVSANHLEFKFHFEVLNWSVLSLNIVIGHFIVK